MKKKSLLVFGIIFVLFAICVMAVITEFRPKADINLQDRYNIINGRNASFENITVTGLIYHNNTATVRKFTNGCTEISNSSGLFWEC